MKKILLVSLLSLVSTYAQAQYACVDGYLYFPNGKKEYIGSDDCREAKFGNGYACVDGYFYTPDGTKTYVGTSNCKEDANLGNSCSR